MPNIPYEDFVIWQAFVKLRKKDAFSKKSDEETVTWENYIERVKSHQNVSDISKVTLPSREELSALEAFPSKVDKNGP